MGRAWTRARPRKSPDAISADCFFLLLFLCVKEKVNYKIFIKSLIADAEIFNNRLENFRKIHLD